MPSPRQRNGEGFLTRKAESNLRAELARLRELAAAATRAHTRACWALKGDIEYPEDEQSEMGAYLTRELQSTPMDDEA